MKKKKDLKKKKNKEKKDKANLSLMLVYRKYIDKRSGKSLDLHYLKGKDWQDSIVAVNDCLSLVLDGLKTRKKAKSTYILKNAAMLNSVHTVFLTLIYTHH